MAKVDNENTVTERPFGITASRIRGAIALFIIGFGLYLILFESDPPPNFEEVEIKIPPKPETNFDERSVVLPDFEADPTLEEEPVEGVEIEVAQTQKAPDVAIAEPIVVENEVGPNSEEEETNQVEVASNVPQVPADVVEEITYYTLNNNRVIVSNSGDNAGYFVQVAALSNNENARKLIQDLALKLQVSGYISRIEQLHRVRLGPFTDEAQAENVKARLWEEAPSYTTAFVEFE